MLEVQKMLDEMGVSYVLSRNNKDCISHFVMDDIGGDITVADCKASFICSNGEDSISLDHRDAEKWLKTYVQDSPEDFLKVVRQTEWSDLKGCLFIDGYDAVSDFLGYDYNENEDKDVTDNRLDEAYTQMPREEFVRFYRQYVLGIEA